MAARRHNPNRVRLHRSYSVQELAECLSVHKNTVRHWQEAGLTPNDDRRPALFHGATVRDFLKARQAARKRPCSPGTMYCLRCREPRAPALAMVDFVPIGPENGNLRAICGQCEAIMHRRAKIADLPRIMPQIAVQIGEGQERLSGCSSPSLNCDMERQRRS